MDELLLLEDGEELLLEDSEELELNIPDDPIFVWMLEIPFTGVTEFRDIDKSQLLFGFSMDLEGTFDMDYFRRYLNDLKGIE